MTTPTPTPALAEAAAALTSRLRERPLVAVVLGSGLGGLAGEVQDPVSVGVGELPGLPVPRVAGHAGRLVAGRLAGVPVLTLAGRVHLYEGYTAAQVARATRLAAAVGCRALLATNAAGGINPDFQPADLMVVSDHVNLLGDNPLRGEREVPAGGGTPFVDLSDAYDPRLRAEALAQARAAGVPVREGVYLATPGPSYETPAEIAMFRAWGADAVGMSTVPEVIAARADRLRVAAVSAITNVHRPGGTPTSHEEVLAVGAAIVPRFRALVLGLLPALADTARPDRSDAEEPRQTG